MTTNSSLYGKGVFTTLAVCGGKKLHWEKHWNRLASNATSLGIDLFGYSKESVNEAVEQVIAKRSLENGRVRITFFDDTPSELWPSKDRLQPTNRLEILAGDPKSAPHFLELSISPFHCNSRSPLVGVKSCNYLEQILSLDEAKGRGFHEAIRVNERGHVTSGCMSNIFWLKDERLYTPTLATGCLAGTTREYVLENLSCEEVEAEIGEFESVEAIYLTSAGLGIVRVAEFDGRELTDTAHPIQTLWPPS